MFKVTFSNTGDEVELEKETSLRELSKEKGWPIAFGCEDGVCGTCIVEVEDGSENMNEPDDVENQTLETMMMKDGKHRLACKCQVKGDVKFKAL